MSFSGVRAGGHSGKAALEHLVSTAPRLKRSKLHVGWRGAGVASF